MDIEERARELLIAEYKARGELVHAMNIERGGLSLMYGAEIAAIGKALTPPEGWVLVPVEPSSEVIAAGWRAYDSKRQDMNSLAPTEPPGVGVMGCVYKALLAARPEVPDVSG